jgi:hypothetical protein
MGAVDRGASQFPIIKNYRSADCVVGGFRYNEGKPLVGSLLLGLYDNAIASDLAPGCCAGVPTRRRFSARSSRSNNKKRT